MTPPRPLKIGLVTLGCPKNLVDSEVTLGLLTQEGFTLAKTPETSDIAIVNTCGFIHDAKKESIEAILDLLELKKRGKIQFVIVSGCLAERYGCELRKELAGVDAFVGARDMRKIISAIRALLAGKSYFSTQNKTYLYHENSPRLALTPFYSRYIKIAEGCSHRCAFCVIPDIRGPYRSRPMSSIVKETTKLAAQGAREINLLAQDLTFYGMDTHGKLALSQLIRKLDKTPGVRWIRLLYAYPSFITPDLIRAIQASRKVCHYIDMPLQHASDRILKVMKRGITKEKTIRLIKRLRALVPDIVIRTAFIVGFPGETERDFAELKKFIRDMRFDKVGIFTYSDEEGTPAFKWGSKVRESVKNRRRRELMKLQQGISSEIHKSLEGKVLDVLIEEKTRDGYRGRSYRDAPEIDGTVRLTSQRPLEIGEIVPVRILRGLEYDLVAKCVN